MSTIKMPALSPTMTVGTISKWLVNEGDEVVSGDILAEIETDKATMELEAIDDGEVSKILVQAGEKNISVGKGIALGKFTTIAVNSFPLVAIPIAGYLSFLGIKISKKT